MTRDYVAGALMACGITLLVRGSHWHRRATGRRAF